ncbi:hypothetical protein [Streptomyces sp. NPDC059168]
MSRGKSTGTKTVAVEAVAEASQKRSDVGWNFIWGVHVAGIDAGAGRRLA